MQNKLKTIRLVITLLDKPFSVLWVLCWFQALELFIIKDNVFHSALMLWLGIELKYFKYSFGYGFYKVTGIDLFEPCDCENFKK